MDDDNTEGYLILVAVIGLALYPILMQIKLGAINFYNSIINFTQTHTFYSIAIILLTIIFFSLVFYFYIMIKQKIKERKDRESHVNYYYRNATNYLNKNYEEMSSKELQKHIKEGEAILHEIAVYNELSDLYKKVRGRVINSEIYLEYLQIEHNKNMSIREEIEIEERINKLESEERMKLLFVDEKDSSIMRDLEYKIEDISVIKKEGLSKEKIQTLIRKGYKQVNEYCLYEQKIIPVLVYPPLNHSPTHTFLVWSAKKLLKQFDGINTIVEHATKFADITFKYKSRYYAIEIETGKSIRHKKRMQEKTKFLNSKFGNRWFFIVSNKNLVPKYRKLGPATQRSEVTKMLENTLKIDHPDISGGNEHLSNIKY